MIYLKTVDEAGRAIDATTLNTIEATVADAVPRWTSGKLGVPTIERGTDTRVGQSGWITIRFPSSLTEGVCGTAEIARKGGWIELSYTRVSGGGTWTNPDLQHSVRELAAARIAYARPVGNTDPDIDPAGAVSLMPMSVR
jgi:hypothetical protein